jgi:hypothetical protein
MAKQIIEFEPLVDVKWPLLGISRRLGFQSQPSYTCPDALNVRNDDVFERRLRGGSRPGLVQVLPPKTGTAADPTVETFMTDIPVSKDGGGESLAPGNSGGPNSLLVGLLTTNIRRSWLHFDLTQIPTGATIVSGTLLMSPTQIQGTNGSTTCTINRLTQPAWIENEATWLNYKSGTAWATAGGDFTATGAVSYEMPTTFAVDTLSVAITALVQEAVDNLTDHIKQLHLLLKKSNEGTNQSVQEYRQKEFGEVAKRPHLAVTYEVAA